MRVSERFSDSWSSDTVRTLTRSAARAGRWRSASRCGIAEAGRRTNAS